MVLVKDRQLPHKPKGAKLQKLNCYTRYCCYFVRFVQIEFYICISALTSHFGGGSRIARQFNAPFSFENWVIIF
jgi:hypothetical protein